jgi:hypothetical protein
MNNNDNDIDFDPDYLKWKEQDLLNSIDFYERSLQGLAERTAKYQRELEKCRIMLAQIKQTKKER